LLHSSAARYAGRERRVGIPVSRARTRAMSDRGVPATADYRKGRGDVTRGLAVHQLVTAGSRGLQGRLVVLHAASKTRRDHRKSQHILDTKIKSSLRYHRSENSGLRQNPACLELRFSDKVARGAVRIERQPADDAVQIPPAPVHISTHRPDRTASARSAARVSPQRLPGTRFLANAFRFHFSHTSLRRA